MTEAPQPTGGMGHNNPPEDSDPLLDRLKETYSGLEDETADLEMRRIMLPLTVDDEETALKFTELAGEMKSLARRVENARVEEKDPFLKRGRTVDAFFNSSHSPLTEGAKDLEKRLNSYATAKRERERAERMAREAEERRKAEEARRAEEAARQKAEEARRVAEAEAARIRSASDKDEREAAEAAMREAERVAAEERKKADASAKEAAAADRLAASNLKAATGNLGQAAKVTSGGASASAKVFWAHEIRDRAALIATLGTLGPFIAPDAVDAAVAQAKRAAIAANEIENLTIAGVRFFEETETTVRTSRTAK